MAHVHPHHDHHHERIGRDASRNRSLARAGWTNFAWAGLQAAAGLAMGSAALLSDSVHNLGDAVGLVMAWLAATLALRKATGRRTWGWHRAELLAGFANALLVLAGALVVFVGAAWKFLHPSMLSGLWISGWALGGIAVNALCAWWIGDGDGDLNRKGAFLHLVSDAAISGAVVLGGIAVHLTSRVWIDPVLALAVSLWLVFHTWPFFRQTLDALLDAVPPGQDPDRIEVDLAGIEGVQAVHDLHLWPLGGQRAALTVHLVHRPQADPSRVLAEALDLLHHRHGRLHATIQVEPPGVDQWHGHEVCSGRE